VHHSTSVFFDVLRTDEKVAWTQTAVQKQEAERLLVQINDSDFRFRSKNARIEVYRARTGKQVRRHPSTS